MDLSPKTFSVADYTIFAIMLGISTAVGFFYAVKDRKKQNTDEYLLAGRSMSPYPVALSLSVGFMSAVLILGTPSEIYRFGTMYVWFIMGFIIALAVTAEIFMPIFYNLGLASVYEYLERRFNRVVRIVGTVLYIAQSVLYIGIVIYAPALALNAVTGFNLWGAVVSTGVICIIYSSLGGLKAVIWTDVIQAAFMLTGFVSIIIQGSIKVGGFGKVVSICQQGGRTEMLRFDLDPRVRHSFWTTNIGIIFLNMGLYAVNQGQVQRYLSCKSVTDAKKAIALNWFGLLLLNGFAVMCGMIMYAYYHKCDPISLGIVKRPDQLLPFMVLDIFRDNPGMPGVFLASIYSGCLSSVSTGITGMSSVTVQDFLRPYFKWSERTYFWISRGLIIFYGLLCIVFAYLTSQLGAILQASLSILGLVGGPLVGLYSLGVLFPCANSPGVLGGIAIGLGMNIWIYVGSKRYPAPVRFLNMLSFDTSGCPVAGNTSATTPAATAVYGMTQTSFAAVEEPRPPVADLYAMSYLYYPALGWCVTVATGLLLSFLTCGHRNRKNVDPRLIYRFFDHVIFSWIPIGARRFCWCGVDHDSTEDTMTKIEGGVRHPIDSISYKTSSSTDGGKGSDNLAFDNKY